MEDGRTGRCVDVKHCPSIYKRYVKNENIEDVCHYSDSFPTVCCPIANINLISVNVKEKMQTSPGVLSEKSKYKIFRKAIPFQ